MTTVERQVKSKRRVADCGEVFTARREVDAMIDLVKEEVERFDSKVLEPSCGDGNFLAPILERKLSTVRARFGRAPNEYRNHSLVALGSLYGVELLDDNARDCRERLFEIWSRAYAEVAGDDRDDDALEIARNILDENIIRGNFLTLRKVDENARDLNEPIMVAEWLLDGGRIVCRREILRPEPTEMETNTLFDMELPESAKEEKEIVVEPVAAPVVETPSTVEIAPTQEVQAPEIASVSTNETPQNVETHDASPTKKTRAKKEADPNKPKRTRKSKKASEETPVVDEPIETPDETAEKVPTPEARKEPEKALVVRSFETKVAVVSRLLEENVVGLAERFLRDASDAINDENYRVCQFDKSAQLDAALDEMVEALTDAQNAARIADLEVCRPKFERFSNVCQKCCNVVARLSSLSDEKRDELTNEAKAIINAISPYL